MKYTYESTIKACYMGYVTLAIIIFFPPLLFVTFHEKFNISLELVGLLVIINFAVQTTTDLLAARFVDKIGYRTCAVAAHLMSVIGLVVMSTFPFILDPYIGLVISTVITAIGGGLIEVIISPIVEAIPGENKASRMSLLHSFLCWGQVAVVLISTLYFSVIGIDNWYLLPIILMFIPLFNMILFTKVPIRSLVENGEGYSIRKLFSLKIFWILFILMVTSGAAEMAVAQWASFFAEKGLNMSKTVGDLVGSLGFAILMGAGRVLYGFKGKDLELTRILLYSSLLCLISFIMIIFSPSPILSLLGLALCGLAVAILWPGLFSLASLTYPKGGTAMFALLAFAGDIGCSIGPGVVGFISGAVEKGQISNIGIIRSDNLSEAALKLGLLVAIIFPLMVVIGLLLFKRASNKNISLS